ASDLKSDYQDSDVENEAVAGAATLQPGASAPTEQIAVSGGTDDLNSEDDGTDNYNSGDTGNITATSVGLFGAVTTITIGVHDSHNGTATAHDDVEDDETLPGTGSSGTGDSSAAVDET